MKTIDNDGSLLIPLDSCMLICMIEDFLVSFIVPYRLQLLFCFKRCSFKITVFTICIRFLYPEGIFRRSLSLLPGVLSLRILSWIFLVTNKHLSLPSSILSNNFHIKKIFHSHTSLTSFKFFFVTLLQIHFFTVSNKQLSYPYRTPQNIFFLIFETDVSVTTC